VLYNEKSKLSLAELSAKFDTLGSILWNLLSAGNVFLD
jgi:hypothetical protein